ncbi:hypothetical protein NX02_27595 [Sphingomonas sanxanigenens DSM 19645 = NX02]|uniref:PepSY domain-containing protein n=2 Tax=Sphingomonas sanxanigenens TaxID=397260 RepID=W0ALC8_9SPHN|nr:hypothetical protein NX02_27595 [Sphingomonas sanxanigenens DSM 19645 = NX02]
MTMTKTLLLPVLLGGAVSGVAFAQSVGDQYSAYAARQRGDVQLLSEIEQRVKREMRDADYLGPEYDSRSGVYRLKFMRHGSVIWVDVDGRTGAVIGRSGR